MSNLLSVTSAINRYSVNVELFRLAAQSALTPQMLELTFVYALQLGRAFEGFDRRDFSNRTERFVAEFNVRTLVDVMNRIPAEFAPEHGAQF